MIYFCFWQDANAHPTIEFDLPPNLLSLFKNKHNGKTPQEFYKWETLGNVILGITNTFPAGTSCRVLLDFADGTRDASGIPDALWQTNFDQIQGLQKIRFIVSYVSSSDNSFPLKCESF